MNENSDKEDLKYLHSQRREEHNRAGLKGERNIHRMIFTRKVYAHVSKCRKLFYILLVPGSHGLRLADREHVITLHTRDKRYLSSNFLVVSASVWECANFFHASLLLNHSFPFPAWKRYPIEYDGII